MTLPNTILPMSIDEFHVMEHRLGWKHEYWDGAARLSCQSTAVASWELTVANTSQFVVTINSDFELRQLSVDDRPYLVNLFARSFAAAVEYAGWSDQHYQRDAQDSVSSFFEPAETNKSRRVGGLLEHSFGFFSDNSAIAAIMIRPKRLGPIIEPVMVHPDYQRFGLGMALLSVTLNSLRKSQHDHLYSRTHLGNLPSFNWHQRCGFREIPDYFASTHRAMHFQWQASHFRHAGLGEKEQECREQADYWSRLAEEIESTKGIRSDLH